MSQYEQDELAQLFAQNMNFSQPFKQHPSTPDKQFIMHEPAQPQIVYSSMHYTGTSYLVPTNPPSDTRADSPFDTPSDDLENTLRRNGINSASLSPSQIKLFSNADYQQRLRLLELWRISPPEYDQPSGTVWHLTSLAQEEELARLRYERRMSGQGAQESMLDQEVEPYVQSGYAAAPRSDPVYASFAGSWQAPNYHQPAQSAGDHLGHFQQPPFRSSAGDLQHDDMIL